jgi:hypothetical protein
MPISFSQTPGALKKLTRMAKLQEQRTFHTPLKNLGPFVANILSAVEPIRSGRIIIDEVVFEPCKLNALLALNSISTPPMRSTKDLHDWTLECTDVADT